MPNVKAWKRFEAWLAKCVGTRRIPVTGERDGADFETGMFVYSAKHRASQYPLTVARWLERVVIRALSRSPEKVGVLVIGKPRAPYDDAIVVLRWKDWRELHGCKPADDDEMPPLPRPLDEAEAGDRADLRPLGQKVEAE